MLVALDTATRFASVALLDPAQGVRAEHTWQTGNNHTVEMMPSLVDMLERQGLDAGRLSAVAVTIGPGSFTGLRIGLALAKGLALSLGIPIIGIPTLAVLPYAVGHASLPTWSVIQAGRGRLCYAEFQQPNRDWQQSSDLEVGTIDRFVERLHGRTLVCGELLPEEREKIRKECGGTVLLAPLSFSLRRAAFLAAMAWERLERGEQDDLVTLSPIYLHHSDSAGVGPE